MKHSTLAEPLKRMEKNSTPFRMMKNRFIHRSEPPSLDLLDRLDSYRFLDESASFLGLEPPKLMPPVMRKGVYDMLRRELIDRVQDDAHQKTDDLLCLLNAADSHFHINQSH